MVWNFFAFAILNATLNYYLVKYNIELNEKKIQVANHSTQTEIERQFWQNKLSHSLQIVLRHKETYDAAAL